VCLLAPHLTEENAEGLLAAATHRTKAQVERLVAERFPRTETLALVETIPAAPEYRELAPGQVGGEGATGPTAIEGEPLRVLRRLDYVSAAASGSASL